jgi:hypothetical protein
MRLRWSRRLASAPQVLTRRIGLSVRRRLPLGAEAREHRRAALEACVLRDPVGLGEIERAVEVPGVARIEPHARAWGLA